MKKEKEIFDAEKEPTLPDDRKIFYYSQNVCTKFLTIVQMALISLPCYANFMLLKMTYVFMICCTYFRETFFGKLDFLFKLEYHLKCEKYPLFTRCLRARRACAHPSLQARREFVMSRASECEIRLP